MLWYSAHTQFMTIYYDLFEYIAWHDIIFGASHNKICNRRNLLAMVSIHYMVLQWHIFYFSDWYIHTCSCTYSHNVWKCVCCTCIAATVHMWRWAQRTNTNSHARARTQKNETVAWCIYLVSKYLTLSTVPLCLPRSGLSHSTPIHVPEWFAT